MATKLDATPRNGHEMAPLNTRARGDGTHGVMKTFIYFLF